MKSYSISQRKKSLGNKTWYGRIAEDGIFTYVSLKTTRRIDAEQWLNAMNASRFLPSEFMKVCSTNDVKITEAVESFMTHVGSTASYKTVKVYRCRLKTWTDWCESHGVSSLRKFTSDRANAYSLSLAERLAPKTHKETIKVVILMLDYSRDTFDIQDWDPMKTVKMPKVPKREKKFWTKDEVDLILSKSPDDKTRLFWSLMAFAGLRHEEAFTFGPECISGESIRIIGKGDKEAFIPISPRMKKELSCVKLESGMFNTTRFRKSERINGMLRKVVKLCGLDNADATCHKFRHSFVSNMINSGANITEASRAARHSSISTTLDIYSHAFEPSIRDAVSKSST